MFISTIFGDLLVIVIIQSIWVTNLEGWATYLSWLGALKIFLEHSLVGARVSKKNSYYACILASDYIQQIMASSIRYSSKNSHGLFLKMHNISSADLLWDKKNVEKEKLMSLLIILPWKG